MARKKEGDSQKGQRRVQFPSFTAEQADSFIELVKERLGPHLAGIIDGSTVNMNHLVRFIHVSDLCRTRRDQKGLTIKEISSQLDIPQYRLKAIEGNELSTIVPAFLGRYVEFLDLEEEFQRWLEKNQDVYESLGDRERMG
jgi:hypothetical protein